MKMKNTAVGTTIDTTINTAKKHVMMISGSSKAPHHCFSLGRRVFVDVKKPTLHRLLLPL